jgi:hypothetical protein
MLSNVVLTISIMLGQKTVYGADRESMLARPVAVTIGRVRDSSPPVPDAGGAAVLVLVVGSLTSAGVSGAGEDVGAGLTPEQGQGRQVAGCSRV